MQTRAFGSVEYWDFQAVGPESEQMFINILEAPVAYC